MVHSIPAGMECHSLARFKKYAARTAVPQNPDLNNFYEIKKYRRPLDKSKGTKKGNKEI